MIATQEHKQISFEQINNPDILRKKKMLSEKELSPEDILEAVSMQNPTLLNLISDNNNIQHYKMLEKGLYVCHHNGCRTVLTLNKYNANKITYESLTISKKDYHTNESAETLAYLENGEIMIEKR
jgi:hypothetical protein